MTLNKVSTADENVHINHVLISVSDKSELETFVPRLLELNPTMRIYSTGGTYRKIEKILNGRSPGSLISVSEYTGQPEMQGGLVKTLDFKIYLGLLSETYNEDHTADLERTDAVAFDMVVANLYPFSQTVKKPGATVEDARTNIDIGGPCMLRASAKNFLRVASVCDPGDYQQIMDEMEAAGGHISFTTRYRLAVKAFRHTAEYDSAIAAYMAGQTGSEVSRLYSLKRSPESS